MKDEIISELFVDDMKRFNYYLDLETFISENNSVLIEINNVPLFFDKISFKPTR